MTVTGRAHGRGSTRARRTIRRLLPLVATLILSAAFAAAAGDAVPLHEPVHRAPVRAAAHRSPASVFASVRAHGQPIAVLGRSTALRAEPGGRRLAHLGKHTEFGSPRVLAALEERGGWLRVIASQLSNGRSGWIPASAATLMADPWHVRASLSSRTVEVLHKGRVVRRFSVAIGRPSTPTPTGEFAVTDRLIIVNRGVGYGCCALALSGHQSHLPQGWGGGDRLAIHATNEPGTIGTPASTGCLRASDQDARWLIDNVYLGTLVEIRP